MLPVLLLFLTGIASGAVNAVAGGGILLVFPAFLAAGMSPLAANITANLVGWPGALSAAYEYRKDLRKVKTYYYWLLLPCILGAIIGVVLLDKTSSHVFDHIAPWLILTAVALFIFQPTLHRHLHLPEKRRRDAPYILVGICLFFAAIYGGYFGAGIGFILLALLSFTKLKNIYQIAAVKNLAGACMGIVGTVFFAFAGGIVWRYGIAAMLGSYIGGIIGARFAHRISPHLIRGIIVGIGLILTGVVFFRLLR